jgi:hypothetical protein
MAIFPGRGGEKEGSPLPIREITMSSPRQPPLPPGDLFGSKLDSLSRDTLDFHRVGLGNNRLGPVAITGITAVAARRVVPGVAQIAIQLAFEGASTTIVVCVTSVIRCLLHLRSHTTKLPS